MSQHSKVPMGSLVVDARALDGIVVDIPHGQLQGMRTEQKGYEEVMTEILSNQRALGDKAGVTQSDVERLMELNRQIAQIDQYLPAAKKLYELLTETRASKDDERQRRVHAVAVSVEYRAKASRNDALLAQYEKTRNYRSAVGVKAAKTRKKNAALAEAHETMINEAVEKALAAHNVNAED